MKRRKIKPVSAARKQKQVVDSFLKDVRRVDPAIVNAVMTTASPANLAQAVTRGTPEPWRYARHFAYLNAVMAKVFQGVYKRVIICLPPRYGKTEYISYYCPAWWLGKRPDHRIIATSYAASLANRSGRRVRSLLELVGPSLFNIEVSSDRSAQSDWEIKGRLGGMLTAGIGTGISGRGANLFIIDDPLKDLQQALSKKICGNNQDWYDGVAQARLEPDASIIIMHTRWSTSDMVAYVLKKEAESGPDPDPALRWKVIVMPEIAERDEVWSETNANGVPVVLFKRKVGDPLWPERWPIDKVRSVHRSTAPHIVAAVRQQRPLNEVGSIFRTDFFQTVNSMPVGVQRVRFWDCAATKGAGDYAVGCRMSFEPSSSTFYIEDIVRGQWSPGGVRHKIRETAVLDGVYTKVVVEQEGGSQGAIAVDSFRTDLPGYAVIGRRPVHKKIVRHSALAGIASAGSLILVQAPWNKDFIEELIALPAGIHDDQADAASGAYLYLAEQLIAAPPSISAL